MQLCVDLADDMIGGHTAQLQPIKMTNRSDAYHSFTWTTTLHKDTNVAQICTTFSSRRWEREKKKKKKKEEKKKKKKKKKKDISVGS